MISMRRTLLPGVVAAIGWGSLGAHAVSAADPPLCNTPASYRLFNPATLGPRTSGCGRCEPVPCGNPGFFLDNPRGTGTDDPWRPPTVWPQTRYPVVPAYSRPSYGYYETSWRVLPLCNPTPCTAGPLAPANLAYRQPPTAPLTPIPAQQAPAANGANPPIPRPPVVPPAVQATPGGPPAATPPAAKAPGLNGQTAPGRLPTAAPTVPLQPQRPTSPTNELQSPLPKATPPSTSPGMRNPIQPNVNPVNPNQGALPEGPQRSAMLELEPEQQPEIRVQPF